MGDVVNLVKASAGYANGIQRCDSCVKPILPGQFIYILTRDKSPWLCEDADDQDYEIFEWHVECDPGTIAADEAIPIN